MDTWCGPKMSIRSHRLTGLSAQGFFLGTSICKWVTHSLRNLQRFVIKCKRETEKTLIDTCLEFFFHIFPQSFASQHNIYSSVSCGRYQSRKGVCSLIIYSHNNISRFLLHTLLFVLTILSLWCWCGGFAELSRVSLVGNRFLYSVDLNVWYCGDIVQRNKSLIVVRNLYCGFFLSWMS